MVFREIKSRKNLYLLIVVATVFVLISACGDDQGSSGKSASDTGSLSFNLAWEDRSDLLAVQKSSSGDVCEDYAIETIKITVTDSSGDDLASAIPRCDLHESTIEGVPAGSDLTVSIAGIVAENVIWQGHLSGITVYQNQNTHIEKGIVMKYVGDDVTPPTVTTHYPTSGAPDVALNPVISATFSENVVTASVVSDDSCTVFETNTANQVTCTVKFDPETHKVTITPQDLSPNSEYTVTITTNVQDLAGHGIAADYSWNFTTGTSSSGLHGVVEDLGNGKVRISYDFSSSDQLLDWGTPEDASTRLEIVDGALKVSYRDGGGSLAVSRLKKELRTDLLQYEAKVIESKNDNYHINFYVRTQWDGSWHAKKGYGGIHRKHGRVFAFKGIYDQPDWGSKIIDNHRYEVEVTISDKEISWDVDGEIVTRKGQIDTNTNRSLLLGAWESTVLFDNIVIEGELDE